MDSTTSAASRASVRSRPADRHHHAAGSMPDKRYRTLAVHCLTFNVNCVDPPADNFAKMRKIEEMLRIGGEDNGQGEEDAVKSKEGHKKTKTKEKAEERKRLRVRKHDVYAIAFQEVSSRLDRYFMDLFRTECPWTRCVTQMLAENGFKRVARIRLLGAVLVVFVHVRHLLHVREVERQYLRLSHLGMKGAVAIRMKVYGVSLCFVNTHLTAHDWNLLTRIDEYNRIVEYMHFKSRDTSRILYHDYIVWMGDLNFRLEENSFTFREIVGRVRQGELQQLLEKDQLKKCQRNGQAFSELSEAAITFPPTFKFAVGGNGDEFDPKRRPAWADRILHRCNTYNYENQDIVLEMESKVYERGDLDISDHKPVVGCFNVIHFAKNDAVTSNVAAFGPIVTFHRPDNWRVGADAHAVYEVKIGELGYTTKWDWIGLFKADFSSLDSWLSFNYASPCRRTGIPKAVTFPANSLFQPGPYRLLYIGRENCVLGMSAEFQVDYPLPTQSEPEVEIAEEALEGFHFDEAERRDTAAAGAEDGSGGGIRTAPAASVSTVGEEDEEFEEDEAAS